MNLFQPVLLRKADYLHLQGSVGVLDVSQHIFINTNSILDSSLGRIECFSLAISSLAEKLINCLCGISPCLCVKMSMPKAEVGRVEGDCNNLYHFSPATVVEHVFKVVSSK